MCCSEGRLGASVKPPPDWAAACGTDPAWVRAVPFTPSQGIATPSPTNVAAGIWYSQYSPHLFSQPGTPGHPYAVVWGPVRLSFSGINLQYGSSCSNAVNFSQTPLVVRGSLHPVFVQV